MSAATEEVVINEYQYIQYGWCFSSNKVFLMWWKSLQVKESFGLGKEETSSFRDGSAGSSKHGKTEASSNADDKSQNATSSYILFNKLRSTLSSASPVVSGAFAKLRDTRVSTLAKQGYEIVKDELSSGTSRKKKNLARHASAAVEKSTRTDIVIVPTKRSVLGEKWEAIKNKVS
jgi:import inner membrane translocase subunit TIM44